MRLQDQKNAGSADLDEIRQESADSLARLRVAIEGLKEEETRVFLTCLVNRHKFDAAPQGE